MRAPIFHCFRLLCSIFRVGRFALPILCLVATSLHASENPLNIELVSEVTSIQPGKPFHVALHLQHPEGYHSYWKFTGIVGVPTSIEWRLPNGWKADPINWPAPERVLMFDIKAQGFHGDVVLPILITPPQDAAAVGQRVTLEGKASWMCCGRSCHPGFKELSLELPVSAEAPQTDTHWKTEISKSLANVPKPSSDWTTEAKMKDKQIELKIQPITDKAKQQLAAIKDVTFFTEDGLVDPNQPEALVKDGSGITLLQTISEYAPKVLPERFTGILQTPQCWLPDGVAKSITISPKLTP